MSGKDVALTGPRMRTDLAKAQVKHRPQGKHHVAVGNMKNGSNQSAYLLRRLARGHEDILAAYEGGS